MQKYVVIVTFIVILRIIITLKNKHDGKECNR